MRNIFALALLAVSVSAQQELDQEAFDKEFRELEDQSILDEGRSLSHYYYTTSTYRNGKSREYGLKSSSYYKLKNTIQVFNNG